MGQITKVIEVAESYIGAKEGDKRYTDLINLFETTGLKYDGQGCCEIPIAFFIKALGLARTKELLPVSNYALGQSKMWKLQNKPVPGCIAYFGSKEIDHEEFVTEVKNNQIITIDGNHNHQIILKTRYLTDRNLKGFGIPRFFNNQNLNLSTWTAAAINSVSLQKGSHGDLVLWLQEFLTYEGFYTGYWDGVFGDYMDLAVKKYQKAHNLLVDGICGKYFWSEVLL